MYSIAIKTNPPQVEIFGEKYRHRGYLNYVHTFDYSKYKFNLLMIVLQMPNCVDNWAELPFQTSEEKYNSKSAGEEGLPTLKNIMKCFDLENTVTYMARTARLNVAGLRMVISDNALSHWSFFEMKGIRCRAHLANLAADDWLRHASGYRPVKVEKEIATCNRG
ncbi:hypothetical protein BT96DRAFT_938149 [Gymnopus androsaceus JB14]|uniref:Uncharacterized protein n=1 Tax=Gymnopus androsaceus JB14 TaxID=1447944 RepID=A0A6A4HTW2_9AGAR|nr:hypothetical protein BT96DRAFT_938149 [Gymnopus androsaceus JB14]